MPTLRSLLRRVLIDLEEIRSLPYPGIEVEVHDDDVRRMCLMLSPLDGPLLGLRLHFDVTLPENWVR